jgi:hypothetical protein
MIDGQVAMNLSIPMTKKKSVPSISDTYFVDWLSWQPVGSPERQRKAIKPFLLMTQHQQLRRLQKILSTFFFFLHHCQNVRTRRE